jgi:hypothetical protein
MRDYASELAEVLEDGFLEHDFEVDTESDPSASDIYLYVIDKSYKNSGHFRITQEGNIFAIGTKPDRAVMQLLADMGVKTYEGLDHKREIAVNFETITEESAAQGDVADRGEYDVNEILPDFDETFADAAVKYLHNRGARESGGDWFESEADVDYETGEATTYSYHLKGFTEEEEDEIWRQMKGRRSRQRKK